MKRSLIIAILFAAGFAGEAAAQAPERAGGEFGNFYVGLSAGALLPQDVHQTVSGSFFGLPVSGSGNFSYKPGFMIDGLLGYHYNDYLAAEADLAYSQYDDDKISGQIAVGPFVATGAKVDGNADTWWGFANGIVTPLGRAGFSPYVGGGLGFSAYDAKLNSITSSAFGVVPVNASTSGTNLAADAIVGFDYTVTSAFSLGARYRFIWTNSARTSTSMGITAKEDDALYHVFSVTAKYRF